MAGPMTVKQVLDSWRALPLHDQIAVAKAVLKEIGAVKLERSSEAQAELKGLGGEHELDSRDPEGASKYRSLRDASQTWAGIGEPPLWLQEEMDADEKPLGDFKVR